MFEKFGEFDSYEEINRSAAAQLAEGDIEAIFALAQENGLDKEDVQDYIDGYQTELTTPAMAAMGKLGVESRDLKITGNLMDQKDLICQMCMEDPELCLAVRKKGKSLSGCLGAILKVSFDKKVRLNEKIVKAAGLRPPLYLYMPGIGEVKTIIREYYMGEKK